MIVLKPLIVGYVEAGIAALRTSSMRESIKECFGKHCRLSNCRKPETAIVARERAVGTIIHAVNNNVVVVVPPAGEEPEEDVMEGEDEKFEGEQDVMEIDNNNNDGEEEEEFIEEDTTTSTTAEEGPLVLSLHKSLRSFGGSRSEDL